MVQNIRGREMTDDGRLVFDYMSFWSYAALSESLATEVAEKAQQLYDDWLYCQQNMYGNKQGTSGEFGIWSETKYSKDTHQSKLVCISEIVKPCRHVMLRGIDSDASSQLTYEVKCFNCGAILKPTGWEEVRNDKT